MADSMNEALIDCVKAAGGSKAVGAILWPEKEPMAAQRVMLDCLSEDRPAKLSPEQVLHVFRLARAKGCHVGMQFMAQELGYAEPQPVDPRDELADLLRISNELQARSLAVSERIAQALPRAGLRAIA